MENAVVTLYKKNADDGIDVFSLLSALTLTVKEMGNIIIFIPIPGKLLSMLQILKKNNVPHQVIDRSSLNL